MDNNQKFKDAVVFVPVCANCGVAVINRDQIDAGRKLELHKREGLVNNHKYLPWRDVYYDFSPRYCPRCHTEFTSAVIPFVVEDDPE